MPVLSPVLIDVDVVSIVLGVLFNVSLPRVVVDVSEFISLLLPELHAIKLITITAVAKTFFIVFMFFWLTISGRRPKLLAMYAATKKSAYSSCRSYAA